jgi:hypothetical protein
MPNDPKPLTPEELLELDIEHVRQVLIGSKDQFLTTFTLVKRNGHIDICATPWENDKDKREMVFSVCLQALKEDVVAYSWASEAWFASSSFTGSKEQQAPPVGPRPMDRPDRREGIVIITGNGKEHKFKCLEILRDESGACKELELQEEAKGFKSWITDSLDRVILLNTLDKGGKFREKIKGYFKEE